MYMSRRARSPRGESSRGEGGLLPPTHTLPSPTHLPHPTAYFLKDDRTMHKAHNLPPHSYLFLSRIRGLAISGVVETENRAAARPDCAAVRR